MTSEQIERASRPGHANLTAYRLIAGYLGDREPADLSDSQIRCLVGMIETGEIEFRHLQQTGGTALVDRVCSWSGTGPTRQDGSKILPAG